MIFASIIACKQKSIDLVFATSTPLTVGIPALLAKLVKRIPYIFEVRDLWPEFPIQIGAINNKHIIKLLYAFEALIYKKALHIIALSPGMKKGILEKKIPNEKISVVPNMAKIDIFFPREIGIETAQKYKLDSKKFKVIHFGAMGVANGLDFILDTAKLSAKKNINEIEFILLGNGMMETHLKNRVENENLKNIQFIDSQPMNIVSEIVNCCQVSLITFLDLPILYTNSPNKLFDSLSAGKPIIVNSNGWTREMVEKNNCGFFVSPENPSDLINVLMKLMKDKELYEEMALNSRRLAEKEYDKSILAVKVLNIIEDVFKNR